LFETVVKRRQQGKTEVTCESGEDVLIESLLTGFPRPQSVEGRRAFESEIRRRFTEQLRSQRERIEKTCPSVFTLVPSRDFKLLDTWIESVTKEEELELALYCEHESGWHATEHSLYRFRADQQWLGSLKEHWRQLAGITKQVGPLAKAIGKAATVPWLEAAGLGIEKLPEPLSPATSRLSTALGDQSEPELVGLETRHLLERLIEHLDSQRPVTKPANGGLYPYLVDDGRLLWLCPDHQKVYRGRS
jgi:hypothetical protein